MKREMLQMTMTVDLTVGPRTAELIRSLAAFGMTPTLSAGPRDTCIVSVSLDAARGPFQAILIDLETDRFSLMAGKPEEDLDDVSKAEAFRAVVTQHKR